MFSKFFILKKERYCSFTYQTHPSKNIIFQLTPKLDAEIRQYFFYIKTKFLGGRASVIVRVFVLKMEEKPKTRQQAWDNRAEFDQIITFSRKYQTGRGCSGEISYDETLQDIIESAAKERGWVLLSMEEYSSLPDE